jgi:hypothetical protein
MHLKTRATLALLVPLALAAPAAAVAVPAGSEPPMATTSTESDRRATLLRYAEDTWSSFEAMTDEDSGLPADRLNLDGTTSVQTSTTNIGSYMWSAVVAERLGIIDRDELVDRLSTTLSTIERMDRHAESGQFFNWYDHRTGEKLTVWPPSGTPIEPQLSSVDNAWLATGLQVVRGAVPELAERAGALYDGMDFGFYYVPERNLIMRAYVPSTGATPCCYDTLGEVRMASWIGIGNGEIPRRHYFGPFRTFPPSCDFSWTFMRPVGEWRSYLGVDVFEGAYTYRGMRIVPNWGGSMFEALMVPLFVPEEEWGPHSWRINHPLFVRAQIEHGLNEAQYGYWGFSPAEVPEGGYRTYGVSWLGMDPDGYPSNNDGVVPRPGYEGCPGREPQPLPDPEDYTNGVVTPHASFLALRYAPDEAMENLANLESDFDIYTDWGFRDSVNVDTGTVAPSYLSLDQGMTMAAIGNYLADDVLREAFVTPEFLSRLRPLMAIEEFANFDSDSRP